ncbi:MAG: glycosyltransferase family 39 protein [Chloroflexota bacterium]|nr:glycosyltransferase family 39 protein [Chloroflexota bacterium]
MDGGALNKGNGAWAWRAAPLVAVLFSALLARIALLASGAVSFHSDEAVVALMARHILAGARPVFFYGQAYMGSLDAWIVASAFQIFGESVLSIRIAQSALYLLTVAVTYGVTRRLTGRTDAAFIAGLLLAIPPVLLALYTTATLGGYNEVLLFGGVVWWMGFSVTHNARASLPRWLLLGVCAGVGWWSNALIVAYALPAGLLILLDLARSIRQRDSAAIRQTLIGIGAAALAFLVGSAPWWVFNVENNFAGLSFLTGSTGSAFAGADVFTLPLEQRLIGLFLLGLPTLIGLRFPWSPAFFAPIVGVIVLASFVIAVVRLARRDNRIEPLMNPDARGYVLVTILIFCLIYFASRFSFDPTGRYFLPLALPLLVAFSVGVVALKARALQIAVVALIVGYFAAGQISAATTLPPGLTTQFNLDTHIPNDDDAALIAYLEAEGLTRGYTNYWIAFRLAFLSGERLIYSAALPYKPDLTYTPLDQRYPFYRDAVNAAARAGELVAIVTAQIAAVDARIAALLTARGVTDYRITSIGGYRVYQDVPPAVAIWLSDHSNFLTG